MRIYDYLEHARGRTYPKVFRNLFELDYGEAFEIERIESVDTVVEAYDGLSGELHYAVYVRLLGEEYPQTAFFESAALERLVELAADCPLLVELYRRRVRKGWTVPVLHATDLRDDKAKVLAALGLDEGSQEYLELIEEWAPTLARIEEGVRREAGKVMPNGLALGDLITDSGESVPIGSLALEDSQPFRYTEGPESQLGASLYTVDFYRYGGERVRVIEVQGEEEAMWYGIKLLHLLTELKAREIRFDVKAVDVRDRVDEVMDAAGIRSGGAQPGRG